MPWHRVIQSTRHQARSERRLIKTALTCLRSKIYGGTRNKKWARLLAYVTDSVSQELLLQNEYLAA